MQRRDLFSALLLPFLSGFLPSALAAVSANATRTPLLISEREWQDLAQRREADPELDLLVRTILERAKKDLNLPLPERKLIGKRLLSVSRELIRRCLGWAFAWRLSGDTVYAERAVAELQAVAAFSDWNPAHYLDVAEMTTGVAITYDWLYEVLTPEQRLQIQQAIIDKGIAQARNGHATYKRDNNWNQVCITGMILGALVVADSQPELMRAMLTPAIAAIPTGLKAYQPDGVYPEGPSYWSYGTTYSVLLLAALRQHRLGDWGIGSAPGFMRSALFYAHSVGPSGKHFNFADGGEGQELAAALVWMARELQQPVLLDAKRALIRQKNGSNDRFATLSALWWPAQRDSAEALETQFAGQGAQPLSFWRSSWQDPDALWFAIKGGGAAHSHAHMDAGSFCLDWAGLRWAKDLGMQDYQSLESRGIDLWNNKQQSPRWKVFRLSAEAHNTLMLDGQPHRVNAMADMTNPAKDRAQIDLSAVLGVAHAVRTAQFAGTSVRLDDQLSGCQPQQQVRWAMCTTADIRIQGNIALLTQQGKQLRLRFEGAPVSLQIQDISAPRADFDAPNPGTRQLLAFGKIADDGSWQLQCTFEPVISG